MEEKESRSCPFLLKVDKCDMTHKIFQKSCFLKTFALLSLPPKALVENLNAEGMHFRACPNANSTELTLLCTSKMCMVKVPTSILGTKRPHISTGRLGTVPFGIANWFKLGLLSN